MGLFGDAGLDFNDFQEDPYQFGDSHWPMFVESCKEPKAGPSGKYGIYVWFEIAHDKFSGLRKFGRWIQLPSPIEVQRATGVAFNPKEDLDDAKALKFLIKFMVSLGFGLDEIAADQIDPEKHWPGKFFMAKVKVGENEQGFDDFTWYNPKPYVSAEAEIPGEVDSGDDDVMAAAEAALAADQNA